MYFNACIQQGKSGEPKTNNKTSAIDMAPSRTRRSRSQAPAPHSECDSGSAPPKLGQAAWAFDPLPLHGSQRVTTDSRPFEEGRALAIDGTGHFGYANQCLPGQVYHLGLLGSLACAQHFETWPLGSVELGRLGHSSKMNQGPGFKSPKWPK